MLSTLALLTAGSAQNQGPPAGYYPPQQNQQTTTTTYYNSPAPNQQGYPPQQAPGGVAPGAPGMPPQDERKAERSTGRPARHNTSNNSNNLTSSPISKPLGTSAPGASTTVTSTTYNNGTAYPGYPAGFVGGPAPLAYAAYPMGPGATYRDIRRQQRLGYYY
ncbi:hypothetical protein N7470_000030 [Penicillium chermesinum]|nr:hypothetical protein N7470_000030 [Penicillium chermesinum]